MKQKEFFKSLKSKSDIREIFTRGKKIKSKYLLVRFIQFDADAEPPVQVVWAVPKIVESAVKRNRLRRILKSSLFEVFKQGGFNETPRRSFKIAIIPRLEFSSLPYKSRIEDMRTIMSKLFKSPYNDASK